MSIFGHKGPFRAPEGDDSDWGASLPKGSATAWSDFSKWFRQHFQVSGLGKADAGYGDTSLDKVKLIENLFQPLAGKYLDQLAKERAPFLEPALGDSIRFTIDAADTLIIPYSGDPGYLSYAVVGVGRVIPAVGDGEFLVEKDFSVIDKVSQPIATLVEGKITRPTSGPWGYSLGEASFTPIRILPVFSKEGVEVQVLSLMRMLALRAGDSTRPFDPLQTYAGFRIAQYLSIISKHLHPDPIQWASEVVREGLCINDDSIELGLKDPDRKFKVDIKLGGATGRELEVRIF
ncbi:MAG: hypothetical protein KDD53_10285 [Bdellovibrionales bacterium]|nr:hypothetical protein [Bdellovibrionales bacterium]